MKYAKNIFDSIADGDLDKDIRKMQQDLKPSFEKLKDAVAKAYDEDPEFRIWAQVNTALMAYSKGARTLLKNIAKEITITETPVCACPHFEGVKYFSSWESSAPKCKLLPFPLESSFSDQECACGGVCCYLKQSLDKNQTNGADKNE